MDAVSSCAKWSQCILLNVQQVAPPLTLQPDHLILMSSWSQSLLSGVIKRNTVLILLFPLEFVKKDKEGDAHWLTTSDWKSLTNEHTVPFSDFTNKQVTTLRPSVLYSLFPLQLRSLTCQQVFSTCSLTTVKQCGIKRELSLDRWFDSLSSSGLRPQLHVVWIINSFQAEALSRCCLVVNNVCLWTKLRR